MKDGKQKDRRSRNQCCRCCNGTKRRACPRQSSIQSSSQTDSFGRGQSALGREEREEGGVRG